MMRARSGIWLAALALALVFPLAVSGAQPKGKRLTWNQVGAALFTWNQRPVKHWNVWRAKKDRNLILLQVMKDWYLISLKNKRLYRVQENWYKAHGENLEGPAPDNAMPLLKTETWDSHDVGPAQKITVQIAESHDELSLELPHPLVVY
jgi:hypothetical protein